MAFIDGSQALAVTHFGDSEMMIYDIDKGNGKSISLKQPHPITVRATGSTGMLIAGAFDQVSVIDINSELRTQEFKSNWEPFSDAPLFAVDHDGLQIATIGDGSMESKESVRIQGDCTKSHGAHRTLLR